MDVQAGAGTSYDPATAIFDEVAASQRTPWPFDMLPKDVLILRRSHQEVFRHSLVERGEPAPDAGQVVQASLLIPDHVKVDTQNAMLQVRSSQEHQPPSDPERRRAYYALLNKAKSVKRTNPRQAAHLEQRARAMMDPVGVGTASADRRGAGRTAPNPPRMAIQRDSHGRLAE